MSDLKEQLDEVLDTLSESKSLKGSLPKPWGVLYAHPNPDGSRKKCENCFLWIKNLNQCEVHAKNITVTKDHICGWHVHGPTHNGRMFKDLQYLDPKLSGLELVKEGTSCNTCEYYKKVNAEKGLCKAVQEQTADGKSTGKQATVDGFGCCCRWEKK